MSLDKPGSGAVVGYVVRLGPKRRGIAGTYLFGAKERPFAVWLDWTDDQRPTARDEALRMLRIGRENGYEDLRLSRVVKQGPARPSS